MKDFIAQEEALLKTVCTSVDQYGKERKEKLAVHDVTIDDLKKQRIDAVDYRDKERLTSELKRISQFDPIKYLPAFEHYNVPYLAGIDFIDDNPSIAQQHLLFGKQGLMVGNKVVVVDWRKAEVSKLFYEWDEGEEYEEDIQGRERTGIINRKISYGIKNRTLLSLKTANNQFHKGSGVWSDSGNQNSTMASKEESGDYHMTDIVSLISRDQFALITMQTKGCLHLTGGAGCGKTTVALHRLSFLLFNQPEKFRQERCLVVMFNRSLSDYVRQTSVDLLGKNVSIVTFHSWASQALRSMGVDVQFSTKQGTGLGDIKKSTGLYQALREYVDLYKAPTDDLADLGNFYTQEDLLIKHCAIRSKIPLLAKDGQRILSGGEPELSFDDAGVLLHLLQLRHSETCRDAVNWYDHILIDEAQDLSIVELKSLLGAAGDKQSMTICADAHQKILDFVDESGFSTFQMDMQKQGVQSESLDVSYRSTSQIMALANRVSGRASVKVVNSGPDPRFHNWDSKQETLVHLKNALFTLINKEPLSLTAIICRYKKEAQEVFAALKGIKGARLQTGSLTFEPGILITNAHQVKGLEFSGVILWNPTQRAYPDSKIGKNLLYVALTRASNRLAVYHYQPLTSLLN